MSLYDKRKPTLQDKIIAKVGHLRGKPKKEERSEAKPAKKSKSKKYGKKK